MIAVGSNIAHGARNNRFHYPEAWWVVAIRHVSDRAFAFRSLIHRLAGVARLAAGGWHIAYLAFTARGRQLFRDLLPGVRDLADPFKVLRYNLGLAPGNPRSPASVTLKKSNIGRWSGAR